MVTSVSSRDRFILGLLVLALVILNYPFLDSALENFLTDYEKGVVDRVIDGDTVEINGTSVRLLGINTPERGERYYEEAKAYMEERVLGKEVIMRYEKEDTDRYHRKLRYLFLGSENINLALVREGYANAYFPSGKDAYYDAFAHAWDACVIDGTFLCERSKDPCASCIDLAEFDVREQRVVFENRCERTCDLTGWQVKDEGRKTYVFEEVILEAPITLMVGDNNDTDITKYWPGETYVWTASGDTLFLRDAQGKLVLYQRY